jgi:putative chitinase
LGIQADGIFGKRTQKAVVEFQSRNGLVPDGIVGVKTLFKISTNKVGNMARSTTFHLTKHTIKKASIEDITGLVNAIIPLFQDTYRIRTILAKGITTIYPYKDDLLLNDPIALAHFFGQIRQEVGRSWVSQENLNYSVKGLINIFSFYRKNRTLALLHGRSKTHIANQQAIANNAYANRGGNGDAHSGDGWRYRGGGSKMVTFKDNHKDLNRYTSSHMPEIYLRADFVVQPNLKWLPDYDLLTGAIFWGKHNLGKKAKGGLNRAASYNITRIINKHTDSYDARWNHTKRAAQLLGVL